LQVAALGHPATTHARAIDYISVEEDFVGDPACFSEKLLLLPKDGQPYRPSAVTVALAPQQRSERTVVHVAVAATTMKLNPGFLAACQEIDRQSSRQIHFHFLIGQAQGLIYPQVCRLIQGYLPQASVYQHQPYQQYLSIFNQCDMFLSPFPFGNTNGIVDAVTIGIPGVCKSGREVFEHIDEGLFKRLGLPDWCITESVEDYVAAAVRLVDDYPARAALYRQLAEPALLDKLFCGRPEILAQRLLQLLKELPSA
jgi:predicted O-linked N-acetylglucosamine transferase (SPINDLY family)